MCRERIAERRRDWWYFCDDGARAEVVGSEWTDLTSHVES